jgi:hypothetical protein
MKKLCLTSILLLIGLTINPLHARSNLIKSMGIGGGICLPQGGWDPGFSIAGHLYMGEAVKYIYFSPYISYAQALKSAQIDGHQEDLTVRYMTLGAKMIGYINSKPQGFYTGGAISYNFIAYDEIQWGELSQGNSIVNSTTTKIGFTGLAGYLFKLRKFSIFIEAAYMFTAGGFNNPSFLTGVDFDL